MKVTSYEELKRIAQKFVEGHFRLLIIVGPPGTSKSTIVREMLGELARWVNASLTAFQFYLELWAHINAPFVIDDVDSLCCDPAMVRLLKALCDSQETRRVCWLTASSLLSDGEEKNDDKPPREFETRSRLIIIANDWKTLNKHIAAVNDRGHIIRFEPSAESVHTEVACWFRDGEIYDFIGRHVRLIGRHHSMRWYVQAADWKLAGLDWRDMLVRSWELDPDDALVLRLLEDDSLTMQERAKGFAAAAAGGKSERRFYYIYRRLRQDGAAQKPLQFCSDQILTTAKLQSNLDALPPVMARLPAKIADGKRSTEPLRKPLVSPRRYIDEDDQDRCR